MIDTITYILSILPPGSILFLLVILSRLHVVRQICKHPELSDEKVKYITEMMKFGRIKISNNKES